MNDITAFLHSSLSCAGADVISTKVQGFLADTAAHVGLASMVTVFVVLRGWPLAVFWAGAALIVFKELAFDLPNAGWAGLVVFDSAFDLLSWFVGFFATWAALARGRVA